MFIAFLVNLKYSISDVRVRNATGFMGCCCMMRVVAMVGGVRVVSSQNCSVPPKINL